MPSELPVLGRAQHHWIVLVRRPHALLGVALLILLLAAVFDPNPMAWIFLLVLCAAAYLRWQTWRAEWIILTRRRLIRVRGVPETTTSEASLRLDRISGVVLVQTVLGKILNYGSIELEAPGQHPDVRNLVKIARPHPFYLEVRRVVFDSNSPPPPEDGGPQGYITTPLPTDRW
jgi:Bacterial PH domain